MNVETEIVNRSLSILGHERIVDINDGNDPTAIVCKEQFYSQLNAQLRDHWWNCAKDRAAITASPDAPAFEWAYKYLLPPLVVKVRVSDSQPLVVNGSNIGSIETQPAPWQREGRYILTNLQPPLYIEFIKKITNAAELDADFIDAMEYRLASRLAAALLHDAPRATNLYQSYLVLIEQAKMNDGQEGYNRQWRATGRYRNVRR